MMSKPIARTLVAAAVAAACLAVWLALRSGGGSPPEDNGPKRPGQEATEPVPPPAAQEVPPAPAPAEPPPPGEIEAKPLPDGAWPEEPLEDGATVLVVRLKLPEKATASKGMVDVWQNGKLKGRYVATDNAEALTNGAYGSVRNCHPGRALVRVSPDQEPGAESGLATGWVSVSIPDGKASEIELTPVVVPVVRPGVRIEPVFPPNHMVETVQFKLLDVTGMNREDAVMAVRQAAALDAKKDEFSLYAGRTYCIRTWLNRWHVLEPLMIEVPGDVAEAKRRFADGVIRWSVDLGTLVECRLRLQQPDGQLADADEVAGMITLQQPGKASTPVKIDQGMIRFWTGLTENLAGATKVHLALDWQLQESYEVVSGGEIEIAGKHVSSDLVLRPKASLVLSLKDAADPARSLPGTIYLLDEKGKAVLAEALSGQALHAFPAGRLRCIAFSTGFAIEEFELKTESGRNVSKDVPMRRAPARALKVRAAQPSGDLRAHILYRYPAFPFIPVQCGKVEGKDGSGQTELHCDPAREVTLVVRDWDMKHAPAVVCAKGAELPGEIALAPGCEIKGRLKFETAPAEDAEVAVMFLRLDGPAAGLTNAFAGDLKRSEDGSMAFSVHLDAARFLPVAVVRFADGSRYWPLQQLTVPRGDGEMEIAPLEVGAVPGLTQAQLDAKYGARAWD